MWKEQKPISSDDNHVIQCFSALYLREKAAFQCHSESETQQEAEILPGWLFHSALYLWLCSGSAVHWYAEECWYPHQCNSPFLTLLLSQRGKRSTRIVLWREHARQMCCLGYWECGFSQLSCSHLLLRAEHEPVKCLFSVMKISDVAGTGVKGVKRLDQGLMQRLSCLFGRYELLLHIFLPKILNFLGQLTV